MAKRPLYKFLFTLILLTGLLCTGCYHTHAPQKILNYIKKNNPDDTSFMIDLGDVFGMNYNYLYLFHGCIPISCVRDIIGISDYHSFINPESFIGEDCESTIIIIVKDGKVIFEDEFYARDYNLLFRYETFERIDGMGVFDGKPIHSHGYRINTQVVNVYRLEYEYYIVGHQKVSTI